MIKEHYILNEKYRPSTLDGYVCTPSFKSKVEKWISEQSIPMLGFFGKPGSGKSTLAKILVKNIDCDYIYLNATEKRSMEDIKNEIIPFVSAASFKNAPKIVILDEATHILPASQVLLLNMIEKFSLNSRFILTGNYPERLIEPLRSRLEEYNLTPPSKKYVAKHLVTILDKEQISYELQDIAQIVTSCYPDVRKTINTCQKFIVDNKLVVNDMSSNNITVGEEIINILNNKSKNKFFEIRQLLADNDVSDFESLYKMLYEDVEKYAPNMEGMVVIIVNEHLYQSNTIIDKEICFMGCIARILETIK